MWWDGMWWDGKMLTTLSTVCYYAKLSQMYIILLISMNNNLTLNLNLSNNCYINLFFCKQPRYLKLKESELLACDKRAEAYIKQFFPKKLS